MAMERPFDYVPADLNSSYPSSQDGATAMDLANSLNAGALHYRILSLETNDLQLNLKAIYFNILLIKKSLTL